MRLETTDGWHDTEAGRQFEEGIPETMGSGIINPFTLASTVGRAMFLEELLQDTCYGIRKLRKRTACHRWGHAAPVSFPECRHLRIPLKLNTDSGIVNADSDEGERASERSDVCQSVSFHLGRHGSWLSYSLLCVCMQMMTACGACGRRVVCAVQSGVGNAGPGAAVLLGVRTRFPYCWQDP